MLPVSYSMVMKPLSVETALPRVALTQKYVMTKSISRYNAITRYFVNSGS